MPRPEDLGFLAYRIMNILLTISIIVLIVTGAIGVKAIKTGNKTAEIVSGLIAIVASLLIGFSIQSIVDNRTEPKQPAIVDNRTETKQDISQLLRSYQQKFENSPKWHGTETPLYPTANRYHMFLKQRDGQRLDYGYVNTDDFYATAKLEIANQKDELVSHVSDLKNKKEEIRTKKGLVFSINYEDYQEWTGEFWNQPNGAPKQ